MDKVSDNQVGCGFFFLLWFFLSFWAGWGRVGVGREAARRGQSEPAPTSVPCSLDGKLSSFFSHSGRSSGNHPQNVFAIEQKNQLQERTHTLPFETEYYGTLSTIN